MALSVVHSTVATLPDEPGAEVNKAEWNASHSLSGAAANQVLFGAADGTISQSANLVFDSNGNLVVNGAPTGAASTDKLQVNGNALIGPWRISSASISSTATTSKSFSASGFALSSLNSLANGAGNDIQLDAAPGGSVSGDSGGIFFYGGSVTSGNSAGLTYIQPNAIGAGNVAVDATFQLGNGPSGDSRFVVTDNAFSGTMTYAPVGDLLTVGNLQFGTYTAGVVVQAGYITVKDAGGTNRRLLVG